MAIRSCYIDASDGKRTLSACRRFANEASVELCRLSPSRRCGRDPLDVAVDTSATESVAVARDHWYVRVSDAPIAHVLRETGWVRTRKCSDRAQHACLENTLPCAGVAAGERGNVQLLLESVGAQGGHPVS